MKEKWQYYPIKKCWAFYIKGKNSSTHFALNAPWHLRRVFRKHIPILGCSALTRTSLTLTSGSANTMPCVSLVSPDPILEPRSMWFSQWPRKYECFDHDSCGQCYRCFLKADSRSSITLRWRHRGLTGSLSSVRGNEITGSSPEHPLLWCQYHTRAEAWVWVICKVARRSANSYPSYISSHRRTGHPPLYLGHRDTSNGSLALLLVPHPLSPGAAETYFITAIL